MITFSPHPRLVLYQDSVNLKFINTREKKIERLDKVGIDHLIIIPFTKEFARNSSEQFVTDYVVKYVHPAKVIIGYDHHFGKNREGNIQLLERLKQKLGYEVEEVPPYYVNGAPVSSTRIRNLLHDGNVKEANRMLGYEYAITGKVVRGQRIGHKIGFPTANLEIPNEYKLITANGVYVCRVLLGNRTLKGMGNIGVRPTIDHGDLTIEVHIFDFDEEIYDEKITIQFVDRLRDEKKFESLEALKTQLAKDKILSIERL
ncbi:FMN adenylyltransferase / Riboflavin kinase [hydrothermal vent metagenome]|uniref:Bifunctional riboflavin kinase/FMN adenylyltransferase n=1 Tax=hydrothermal vent metagenome TaxID=652676 RepID=A0A3B0UGH9_9ZZZZ